MKKHNWKIQISVRNGIRIALLALFMSPIEACSKTPYPIAVGSDSPYYGYLKEGKKFGVTVGDSREQAQQFFEAKGFRYDGEFTCDYTLQVMLGCSTDFYADVYRVQQFLRDGTIVLEFEGDFITSIIWNFNAIPIPDF